MSKGVSFVSSEFVPFHLLHRRIINFSFTVNGVPWPQEATRRNSHTFNCRMLIHRPDEPGPENQEACQRYEVMQCFTVSQPKSIQEDGEGKTEGGFKVFDRFSCGFRNREEIDYKLPSSDNIFGYYIIYLSGSSICYIFLNT